MVDTGRTPLRGKEELEVPQPLQKYGYIVESKSGIYFIKDDGNVGSEKPPVAQFKSKGKGTERYLQKILAKIPETNRKDAIENLVYQLACYEEEARRGNTYRAERQGESQSDVLIKLFLERNPVLFHDQHRTPYARVNINGVNATLPLKGSDIKSLLAKEMWETEEKAPGNEALKSAINVLSAKALFEGEQYTLHNRVAPGNNCIWIDMGDDRWRAIKVTKDGWSIVQNPPVLFKRYSHMKPLCEPLRGGDPWALLDFFNLDEDDDTRLSLMVLVTSYTIPNIPHPILILYGIQGSGKTWMLKLIRSLLDPSSVDVLSLPRSEHELVQQLAHHWIAYYDNITKLSIATSDVLCRASTGGGMTKRELFTNDEDIIYNYRRCVGLNGINIAAQRGDLLDRSILVGLKAIQKEERRTEEELLQKFEAEKPKILGGLLDTLVEAMKLYPSVQVDSLFRMADFTKWGIAIAQALGKTKDGFLKAYSRKNRAQIEEAAHSSPVATVLLEFMHDRRNWDGTPTNLYMALREYAKKIGISTRQQEWPKAPHVLIRYLNELIPALKQLGMDVETGIHTGTQRRIIITQKSVKSVSTVTGLDPPSPPNTTNAFLNTLEGVDDMHILLKTAYRVVEAAGGGLGLPLFKQWMSRKGYAKTALEPVWRDPHFNVTPMTIHLVKKEGD